MFAVVAGFALLTSCTSPPSQAYRTSPGAGAGSVAITGAGFDVESAGDVSQATSDATWSGVLATLNRYLEAAVLTPLHTGGPAGDLAPLFTSLAVDRVTTGPDRAAFIDEGVPPATDLRADAAVATLTALAGADGTVSVVDATLDLRIRGRSGDAPVTVTRTGDIVLLPDGATWRIDAYDITASRTFGGATSTTTARS